MNRPSRLWLAMLAHFLGRTGPALPPHRSNRRVRAPDKPTHRPLIETPTQKALSHEPD